MPSDVRPRGEATTAHRLGVTSTDTSANAFQQPPHMRRHTACCWSIFFICIFFYNPLYDAAAHTIAAGTTKDARDRTFWLRSFAFSGKIKQGIARVSNFALLGMDATRGSRELYRTFLKLDDDDYFRVLHVEPARKAGITTD